MVKLLNLKIRVEFLYVCIPEIYEAIPDNI